MFASAKRPGPTPEELQRMLQALPAQGSAAPFAGMVQSSFRPNDGAPSPTWGMPGHEDAGLPQPSPPFPRPTPYATGFDLSQAVPDGPPRPLGFGFSGTGQRPQADGQSGQALTGGMFANAGSAQSANRPGNGGAALPALDASIASPNLLDQDSSLTPPSTDISPFSPDLSGIPTRHPKFFENDGLGEKLLKGVGEFALQYSAGMGNPAAMANIQNRFAQQREQQLWNRQDSTRKQDHEWDVQSAAAKARQPDYFMSGKDRVVFDPATGTTKVVYDGPSDAEDYATALGFEPGTPGYNTAVSDYVLRGNGSTALQNKTALEGIRVDGRAAVEGIRQRDRLQLRSLPTYSNLHPRSGAGGSGGAGNAPRTMAGVVAPILAKVASGKPLTPAETQAYQMYANGRGHRSGGGGAPQTGSPGGKVYQNAQGHRIVWSGNKWVEEK